MKGSEVGIIGSKGTAIMKDYTEVHFKPIDGEKEIIKRDDPDFYNSCYYGNADSFCSDGIGF